MGVASQTNLGQLNVTHPQTNLGQLNVTHPQSNTTTIQSPLYGTLPLVHPTKRQLPHPLRGSSSEEPTPIYTSVPSVPVGGSVPSVPLGGSVPLGPIASVGQVPTSGMSSGPVGGVAIGNLTPAGSGAVRGVGGAFPNREMEGVLPMMSQVGVCWGFSNVQLVIELLCYWWLPSCTKLISMCGLLLEPSADDAVGGYEACATIYGAVVECYIVNTCKYSSQYRIGITWLTHLSHMHLHWAHLHCEHTSTVSTPPLGNLHWATSTGQPPL